jgi:hypothetical protein
VEEASRVTALAVLDGSDTAHVPKRVLVQGAFVANNVNAHLRTKTIPYSRFAFQQAFIGEFGATGESNRFF